MADFPLKYIISGGQTGADRGGYHAALKLAGLGIRPGGWVPAGRRAEDHRIPDSYTFYFEHASPDYPPRTEQNVLDSDVTIIVTANSNMTAGSNLTARKCQEHGKPYIHVNMAAGIMEYDRIKKFLVEFSPRTINVAGTRESKAPGIRVYTLNVVTQGILGWYNKLTMGYL